ncbi:MAG: hypothetical protein HQK91_06235 [Nitrospirae bacterium]|nr:hypothetical protein [Nitrospirota bacterium]
MTSDKPLISDEMGITKSIEATIGPVGLDIGTSHIVLAVDNGNHIKTTKQLNAFFTVPATNITKKTLTNKNILFFESNQLLYITGYAADNFANMFNTSTRRPIEKGMLNAKEAADGQGIAVIASLINSITSGPKVSGETICFSVPGSPLDDYVSTLYHESMIKQHLLSLGYSPISINEGHAIVMSELAEDDFTGIGISMGGGMCNVCFSFLSVPVITYSIRIGGDYIDLMAGQSLGIPATKVKLFKEESLDLINPFKDKVTTALAIFYEDLIIKLVKSLKKVIDRSENLPMISQAVPIVLSGGSALPNGVRGMFEEILKKISLQIDISSVRLANDPLNSTAKGALIMSMTENI